MIRLDKKYAIKCDGTQYILGVPYKAKGGQINFAEPKYLPTMEMALTTYIRIRQKDAVANGGDMIIQECISKFIEINNEVKEILKPIRDAEKYSD